MHAKITSCLWACRTDPPRSFKPATFVAHNRFFRKMIDEELKSNWPQTVAQTHVLRPNTTRGLCVRAQSSGRSTQQTQSKQISTLKNNQRFMANETVGRNQVN